MKNTIEINHHPLTRLNLLLLVCTCCLSPLVQSEVTLDGSLGPAGALTGPDYKVTENLGKRAGSNLFHSFGRFNLNASESATFSGSTGIKNVISRVTGGQTSTIDGTLRVSIPNANLYLLNPAGVIFGEHATLDVPGSFHVSTADYLKFQDGVRFNSGVATAPQVLATAEPEAFGFLGENPAGITLTGGPDSVLEVQQGSTISLIGGDITSENTAIYAPGGQINLASVGSAGEVSFNESGILATSFAQMGNIRLNQDPLTPRFTTGTGELVGNVDVSDDTAGKIFIRGGRLVMNNSFIASDTKTGNGGGISVGLTGDLNLGDTKTSVINPFADSGITSTTSGEGNAGNISLDVAGLNLTNGARIDTRTSSSAKGNAGNLTINSNTIQLQDDDPIFLTQLTTASRGDGNAGNIAIKTDLLEVRDASIIDSSTKGKGRGGNLTVNAEKILLSGGNSAFVTAALPNSTGDAGNLSVKANTIEVSDDALISSSTLGTGEGGGLNINTDSLKLNNSAKILNTKNSTGNGGGLVIKANTFEVKDASIIFDNIGTGNGGDFIIKSADLDVNNAIILNQLSSSGKGGNLMVKADNLLVRNGASINNLNSGTGIGGSLTVDAGNIILSGNGSIFPTGFNNAATNTGSIGELTVNADNLQIQNGANINTKTLATANVVNINSRFITLSGNGMPSNFITGITVQAPIDSIGNAANLTINAEYLKVRDDAHISTNTFGEGDAGNLTINADHLEVYNESTIAAAASPRSGGDAGNVIIKSDHLEVYNNSFISTATLGSGKGGKLNVNANKIEIRENSSLATSTVGKGLAGDLTLVANDIFLSNDALLATAAGFGDFVSSSDPKIAGSGDINITLGGTLRLDNNSRVTTLTTSANAGNITINNGKLIHLSNESAIQTRVLNNQGTGGNIFISTPIVALDNSVIGAQAAKGQGGNITIKGFLFQSPNSLVTASSELGIDGNIDLKPDTNISGSLAVLPDTFMNASQQLSERCVARLGNNLSSFVVKGRGGIPLSPGDLAPSNFLDYLPTEGNSPQGKQRLDLYSLDNNQSSSYSSPEKSYQFASMSIDCTH